jgi:hypothetical protein
VVGPRLATVELTGRGEDSRIVPRNGQQDPVRAADRRDPLHAAKADEEEEAQEE